MAAKRKATKATDAPLRLPRKVRGILRAEGAAEQTSIIDTIDDAIDLQRVAKRMGSPRTMYRRVLVAHERDLRKRVRVFCEASFEKRFGFAVPSRVGVGSD